MNYKDFQDAKKSINELEIGAAAAYKAAMGASEAFYSGADQATLQVSWETLDQHLQKLAGCRTRFRTIWERALGAGAPEPDPPASAEGDGPKEAPK